MTAPRCETCRFWKFDEPDWEFDDLRFGGCKAIRMRSDFINEEDLGVEDDFDGHGEYAKRAKAALMKAKAVAVDGSGYYAAVRCAPDFGCVLHELKESDQ